MNQTIAIQLAEAIVNRLNTGSFSQPFTAKRYYQPKFKLEELQELRVCVVPLSTSKVSISRGADSVETVVQIGVLKKLTSIENESLDPLTFLVEQIADSMNNIEVLANPISTVTGTAINPIFDQKLLNENRQFTSVVELTVKSFV